MVRIINKEKSSEQRQVKLDEKSKALLTVIGIAIAERPGAIENILSAYSVEMGNAPDEKELTEKLITALTKNDTDFNIELAEILLDGAFESSYENFDFKSLFSSKENGDGSQGGGGGMVGSIANAVSSIGQTIEKGIDNKRNATAHTLQGIYAYKAQLAASQQGKNKTKTAAMIAFLILLGVAIIGIIAYRRKQAQEILPVSPAQG